MVVSMRRGDLRGGFDGHFDGKRATAVTLGALFAFGAAACGDSGSGDLDPGFADAGPTPPEILRFEASNEVVDETLTVFLGWETEHAETVTLRADPGETLLEDSLRVNSVVESAPLVTPTTFTLVATGPDGTAEATVDVDVRVPDADAPPRIIEFFVRPRTYQGRTVEARLSWTAVGELALTRNGEPVAGFSGEPFGAIEETVSESFIRYELTATRGGQTVFATGTISRSQFEVEPNDRPADASVPSGDIGRGRIDESDRDLWVIEVPDQGHVTAYVDDSAGGCPFDSVLELFRYDPDARPADALAFVASNDDISSANPCSRIDPRVDPRASSLPGGLYVVRLSGATPGDVGQYRLTIEVDEAECGNAIVEFGVGEACDDGNTSDDDGCSSQCAIEALASLQAPDSTSATTPALLPGERRFAVVELSTAGTIAAALDAPSCEPERMQIRNADELEGADYRLLATSDARCALPPRALPAGRYLVQLDGGEQGFDAARLDLFAAPAGCGDRIVTGTERCDDGNAVAGDGCSPQCELEIAETTSSGLVEYETTLPADGAQVFELTDIRGSIRVRPTFQGTCTTPTRVTLLDSLGRELGAVEDESACAAIDPAVHPFAADVIGTFFVAIESRAGAAQPVYELRYTQPDCGNGILENDSGDEQCDDGGPSANCDRFCNLEVDALLLDRGDPAQPGPIQCAGGAPGVPVHFFDIDPADEIERVAITFAAPTLSAIFQVQTGMASSLNEQIEIRAYDTAYRLIGSNVGTPNRPPAVGRVPFVTRTDPDGMPEPVFVEIERVNSTAPITGILSLDVPCFPSGVCGDSFLELGEQCDDANQLDGDGCSRFCNFEVPNTRELEGLIENRNDSRSSAGDIFVQFDATSRPLVGSLFPPGDIDFFRFEIPSGEAYAVRAFVSGDPSDPSLCRPDVQEPIRLSLLDDAGRTLASSDPEIGCADIDGISAVDLGARDLPAGTYHLRADRPRGGQAMSYTLVVRTVPAP
jgi:cysteine-rich repeat protein